MTDGEPPKLAEFAESRVKTAEMDPLKLSLVVDLADSDEAADFFAALARMYRGRKRIRITIESVSEPRVSVAGCEPSQPT